MAARTSPTRTSGTPRPSGRSHTRATAPRSTASGAKSWPSARKPGTQKKRAPGNTPAVEYASPRISTSGAPFPINSRRVIGRARIPRAGVLPAPLMSPAASRGSDRVRLRPTLIGGYSQVREREGHDLLERRRRHHAAVDLALRLVDHHRHQQARLASRRVADERGHELGLGVAAVPVRLLRRTGLARQLVAVHPRLLRRAARAQHALEHA